METLGVPNYPRRDRLTTHEIRRGPMIICVCRGVTDRVVGATIADGASTLTDIVAACAAGSDCGACHASLVAMLAGRSLFPSRAHAFESASAHGRS